VFFAIDPFFREIKKKGMNWEKYLFIAKIQAIREIQQRNGVQKDFPMTVHIF